MKRRAVPSQLEQHRLARSHGTTRMSPEAPSSAEETTPRVRRRLVAPEEVAGMTGEASESTQSLDASEVSRAQRVGLGLCVGAWSILLLVWLAKSFPVLWHGWSLPWLFGGLVVLGASAWGLFRARGLWALGTWLKVVVGVLLLAGIFSVGAANSLVLHGHVYASTSVTARAYGLRSELRGDLGRIVSYDRLLAYSISDARGHYNEYAPALSDLQSLNTKWSTYPQDSLPDGQFISVIHDVAVAANYGASAMSAKQQLLVVDTDVQLSAQVQQGRNTMAQAAYQATQGLDAIDYKFGFLSSGVHE